MSGGTSGSSSNGTLFSSALCLVVFARVVFFDITLFPVVPLAMTVVVVSSLLFFNEAFPHVTSTSLLPGWTTGLALGKVNKRCPVVCDRFTELESGEISSSNTSCKICKICSILVHYYMCV